MRWVFLAVLAGAGCDDGGGLADPSPRQEAPRPDAAPMEAPAPDAAPEAPDGGVADAAPDMWVDPGPPPTAADCFAEVAAIGPSYDRFGPVLGHHCKGTNHQDIDGVEKVVFLGDSVTYGTPPSLTVEFYRWLVTEGLQARFGEDIEVSHCAVLGSRTDDLLRDGGQIPDCFPEGGSQKRTLVMFTSGGNDIAAWASDRESPERALMLAERAGDDLEAAISWFKEPGRFPNGIFVIYANPYEYTDATGDLESCELAALAGFTGNWIEGADAVIRFNERFMEIAVAHQVDMIFTLEAFCGHGFHAGDPESPCFRGPDAETWFDLTCIHPNPTGHAVIADMFLSVIDE